MMMAGRCNGRYTWRLHRCSSRMAWTCATTEGEATTATCAQTLQASAFQHRIAAGAFTGSFMHTSRQGEGCCGAGGNRQGNAGDQSQTQHQSQRRGSGRWVLEPPINPHVSSLLGEFSTVEHGADEYRSFAQSVRIDRARIARLELGRSSSAPSQAPLHSNEKVGALDLLTYVTIRQTDEEPDPNTSQSMERFEAYRPLQQLGNLERSSLLASRRHRSMGNMQVLDQRE